MEPSQPTPDTSPAVPIAIIAGFAMIAIAIFFTSRTGPAPTTPPTQSDAPTADAPRAIDDSDYIRGYPNAPIVLIEYSDYECPFCKQFHNTMKQIMDEYGVTGRLAWVYRQFPVPQLHPNSPKISEAALCVGDIGGNDAFWEFSDRIYEERDIDEPTNVTKLPEYAEAAGVSQTDYIECMDSGRMEQAVTDSMEDGFTAGVRGTPYTILMVGNQQAVISGAQPYDTVKGIVENLIAQLDGNVDPSQADIDTENLPRNPQGTPLLE
ncbi:MAG: DsbA family protein [Patescibacteria group bacterium]